MGRRAVRRWQHGRRARLPTASILFAVASAGLVAGPCLPTAGGGAPTSSAGFRPALTLPLDPFVNHIQHIVVVMMENHAYDNYFGTYCTVLAPACSMVGTAEPTTCLRLHPAQLKKTPCIAPFDFTAANDSEVAYLLHNYNSSTSAWDNGSMDNFYAAEKSSNVPFGRYNGSLLPVYWDLAEQYGLGDAFFSSFLSYSMPNHWHLIAGQSPQEVLIHGLGDSTGGWPGNKTVYRAEANNTTAIEDVLNGTKVSWKYYDYGLTTYAQAITKKGGPAVRGSAYDYWNPMGSKAESYRTVFASHFVSNTKFYSNVANNSLPALSWVIPFSKYSDHPPANITLGQGWVASIVNALESSPEWNSTALFITWDEYGGFYDHVAPPIVNGVPLGFRVPLLVVSPYARENYISNSTYDFDSLLHLMEWRFGLPCIAADCNASLPLDFFNFSMTPRAPMQFGLNVSYPMALQNLSSPFGGVPRYRVPTEYVDHPNGTGPDVD